MSSICPTIPGRKNRLGAKGKKSLTLGPLFGRFAVFPDDMRDDYIKQALSRIQDPNVLINVVSRRVKQLKRGNRPLVESLEKLTPEDIALREIIDEKISFEADAGEDWARTDRPPRPAIGRRKDRRGRFRLFEAPPP